MGCASSASPQIDDIAVEAAMCAHFDSIYAIFHVVTDKKQILATGSATDIHTFLEQASKKYHKYHTIVVRHAKNVAANHINIVSINTTSKSWVIFCAGAVRAHAQATRPAHQAANPPPPPTYADSRTQ